MQSKIQSADCLTNTMILQVQILMICPIGEISAVYNKRPKRRFVILVMLTSPKF